MLPLLLPVMDGVILLVATLRLVRFFIVDDLGRRLLIPIESRLRGRLSEGKKWVADGFTCPSCFGMRTGIAALVSDPGPDSGQWQPGLVRIRIRSVGRTLPACPP